jgi:integrase
VRFLDGLMRSETMAMLSRWSGSAFTGCRRGEIVNLRWDEVDETKGCYRLRDSKEGRSTRPIGRPAFDILGQIRPDVATGYVFRGAVDGRPFLGFPKAWASILKNSDLSGITPHVLRHSFASTANDLGFTEATGTYITWMAHSWQLRMVASQISIFIRSRRSNEVENTAEARPNGLGIGQIFPIAAE